jgi:bifunctional non-homologous end joining protein LigD
VAVKKTRAAFIEPMLLLRSSSLPEDDGWIREIKLDGYRALAFKSAGKAHLRSRNNKDMAGRYPAIAKALAKMPDNSVIDGELVALDADGRPSINLLQNYGRNTDCHPTGEGKSAISGPRSGIHHGVNIGEMGVRVT